MKFQPILFSLLLLLCISAGAKTKPLSSAEQVDSLISALQKDDTLEEVQQQALIKKLEKASSYLNSAAQFDEKSSKTQLDLSQASSTIEAIQKELKTQTLPMVITAEEAKNLEELEQQQTQVKANIAEARQRLEKLELESKALSVQQANLPEMLAVADARRSELEQKAALPSKPEDILPWETKVDNGLTAAELKSVTAEVNLYKLQLKNFDLLKSLLSARIDQASRHLSLGEAQAATLREAVDEQRRIESEAAAARADEERLKATLHHPEILAIAEHNAELAALRAGENGLSARQREAATDLQAAKKATEETKQRSEEIEERINAAGLTHAVAQLLSREHGNLPDLNHYKPRARARKKEIALTQLALLDFSDQRAELRDITASVKERLQAIGDLADSEHMTPLLTDYLTTQRNQLDTLISEYTSYFNLLVDLDTAEHQLTESVAVLAGDISEHILWIRSDSAFGLDSPRSFAMGISCLTKKAHWQEVYQTLLANYNRSPVLPFLLVLLETALIVASIGAKRRLKRIAGLVAKIRTDRYFYTFEALFYTLLRALPLPILLIYLSWRVEAIETPLFSAAVAQACQLTGLLTFWCALLYQAIRPSGLLEAHFHVEKHTLELFRKLLFRVMISALPLLWLTSLLHNAPESAETLKPLERLFYAILQVIIAWFAYSIFSLRSQIMQNLKKSDPELLIVRFRFLVLLGSVGLPLTIAVATIIGYYITSLQISLWFAQTLGLVFVLSLVEAILIRGIQVVARKAEFNRRIRERQELQQQRDEALAAGDSEVPTEPVPAENDEMNFIKLNENTRKLMSIVFGFALLFGLWVIWSAAVPALGIFDKITVWSVHSEPGVGGEVTTVAITLANLIASGVIIMLTITGARHLPSLLELAVLRQLRIAYGERYAISMVVRYIVVAVGVSVSLSMLGIGWEKFKWLAAALSVGLGFGLQEIFANFISGLILLFERPIRVRDYVTVNGTSGQVSRIQIRATTITDFDNKELLIPNKQFVTGELVNWTLTNSIIRIVLPVGVAYGSDTQRVESTLLRIARSYRLAVQDPEPNAFFTGFGDNSLNFELRVFIGSADQFRLATHELNMAIDAEFRKAGITIAFPQLDLHLDPQPVNVENINPEQK